MLWRKIHHWFIPHKDTHQKARLITWEALLIYVLLFMFLQVSFSVVGYVKPGVLGITSNIDQKRLVELTNQERAKKGLPPVSENTALDKAATLKAQNMFEENYWAHFAPSGKTPWDFIIGAGYKFEYAGENLAKNFSTPEEVITAWMVSPSHRDNIINAKYKEIGFAVVDGVLNGEQTTLVVQLFGTTPTLAQLHSPQREKPPVVNIGGMEHLVPKQDLEKPSLIAQIPPPPFGVKTAPLFDPLKVAKTYGLGVTLLLVVLLILDLLIIRRRGVVRLGSHHLAHLSVLAVVAVALISSKGGSIL